MINGSILSRRTVLAGGLSSALVACSPSGSGDSSSQSGDAGGASGAELIWSNVDFYLSMIAFAGPIGGALAGAMKLANVAYALKRAGRIADNLGWIVDGVNLINQMRTEIFSIPSANAAPRAFMTPAQGAINDFGSVPVIRNSARLKAGVANQSGGRFGDYDLFFAVKPVTERPPRTYDQALGNGDFTAAIVRPAADGSYDGTLDTVLPTGGYVSYTWKLPRGSAPTDADFAASPFIGPAFLVIDDASYTGEVAEAVESGKNVEARFQLADAV